MKIKLQLALLIGLVLSNIVSAQNQKPKVEQLLGVKNASGRDFWIAIPPNELAGFPSNELEIYIASESDADIELYDAAANRTTQHTVQAGKILTLSSTNGATNWAWEMREAEQVLRKGIHITSSEPIVVYVLNSKQTTSDGYLAVPTRAWGSDYIHCSYYDFREFSAWAGGFLVVAKENGTVLDIVLRGVGELDAKTSGGKSINTGKHETVTLDEGEVYMVKGDGTTRAVFDLSGSRIQSSAPVGFISFHERTTMPNLLVNGNGRNHLCEMLPPVNAWGMRYATVEFSRENSNGVGKGDVFRVVASEANTKWTVKYYEMDTKLLIAESGGVLAKDGDFADLTQSAQPKTLIHGYSVWEADKPVLLMQYSCSQTWDGDPILDPFMIYIAPVEQFSTNSIFQSATARKFTKHRLNLIVWADSSDPNYVDNLKSITIDGAPVWNHPASHAPTLLNNRMPGGNMHWCTIEFGETGTSHQILSNEKIRCAGYLYGFGAADAYGWPVGAQYRDLSSIDTASPMLAIENGCTEQHVRVTEARNIPAVPRLKPLRTDQVETGISEIALDKAFANTNYRVVLETSPILGEVAYKDFSFRMEVIDKTKDASARVRVRDFGFTDKNGPSNSSYQTFTYIAPKVKDWPSSVNFGKNRVGEKLVRSVPIKNSGTTALTINDVRLKSGGRFSLKSAPSFPLVLAGGETATFDVEYSAVRDSSTEPAGKDYDSLVAIVGCTELYAQLVGYAVAPQIQVSDANLGQVPAGVRLCSPIYITNTGSDELVITGISSLVGTNFSLSSPLSPPLPIRIPAKSGVNVSSICFQRSDEGVDNVSVTFSSNAALGDSVSEWTATTITDVAESGTSGFIGLSPQPANDIVHVRIDGHEARPTGLSLFDLRGQLVRMWSMDEFNNALLTVPVADISIGTYTLVVSFLERSYALPMVIAR